MGSAQPRPPPPLEFFMALVQWLRAGNGDFDDAADWSGGRQPGASDTADLDAPDSDPYTVTVATNATVGAIQTAANAALNVYANFSATSGTAQGANDGAIYVQSGANLTLDGTVTNVGFIEMFATTSPASLIVGTAGLTLTGGGVVFLDFQGASDQRIIAAPGGGVLDDVDNRISGQGFIGGAGLTLITGPMGFIEAKAGLLTVDTGSNTIINNGTIDAEGLPGSDSDPLGHGVIASPVQNDGLLMADGVGSTLVVQDGVSGTGRAVLCGGVLQFQASFNQDVEFLATDNELILAQSAAYSSTIENFSTDAGDTLDLRDIAFTGPTQASFSGSVTRGILSVTDGAHTARIQLEGDYTQAVFVASSDGAGGTQIVATPQALAWQAAINGAFQTAAKWTYGLAPGPRNDAILAADGGAAYTVTLANSASVASAQIAANATLVLSNEAKLAVAANLANAGRLELAAAAEPTELIVSAMTLSGSGMLLLGDAAANAIVGTSTSATLTNVSNLIAGAGTIGLGRLELVNEAGGRIESNQTAAGLVINTGANTILNAGLLEGAGAGLRVLSAVDNGGIIKSVTNLTFSRAVTGTGRALVAGGVLRFLGSFDQAVTFVGAGGVLALAQSRDFTAGVYGFSATGADGLDLADIGFMAPDEASFAGAATGGILTVSDGERTAHIDLHGDYLDATFNAAADGAGGVMITAARSPLRPHTFIAAMAAHGATPGLAAAPVAITQPSPWMVTPSH
jgi:hypothetical protein